MLSTVLLPPPLHLDTNIFVHAVRGDETWDRIKAACEPLMMEPRPSFSFVVYAEILSIANQWGWAKARRDKLVFFLDYFECMDIITPALLNAYAEIDSFSRVRAGGAIKMGKNDLWIAASAYVAGAVLVTTDNDFDHLNGIFFDRILVPEERPIE